MNKFVTSKMVAEKAGVSRATVSHVVNGRHERVSKKTRERVLKVMDDLGYSPNLIARSMKTRRSQTIGIIIEGLAEGWFTQIILGMEEMLRQNGYQILLGSISPNSYDQNDLAEAINLLLWRRVEGIIIITSSENREITPLNTATDLKVPVVLVNFYTKDDVPFPKIMLGYEDAGREVVKHFRSIGKRRIAFIGYNLRPESNTAIAIFKGFKEELVKCNLPYLPELLKASSIVVGGVPRDRLEFSRGRQRFELGRNAMEELLEMQDPPDAVYCISDHIAYGAIHALRERDIKIPEQVALVGTNNLSASEFVFPGLTSVDMKLDKCGEIAVNTLLSILEGRKVKSLVNGPVELVIRTSSVIDMNMIGSI